MVRATATEAEPSGRVGAGSRRHGGRMHSQRPQRQWAQTMTTGEADRALHGHGEKRAQQWETNNGRITGAGAG